MKRASQRERPPPLRIQKPEDQNGRANAIAGHQYPPQQLYRQPAIYQTRSPDVINADPHDFMAMVQKLTGQARSHGILSPLAKRPCLPSSSSVSSSANGHSHSHNHGSAPAETGRAEMEASGLHGASNSYNLISHVQNLQRKEQLGFAASDPSSASSSASSASSASASASSFSFPSASSSASSSASAEPGRGRKLNLGLGLQQKDHASWSQAVGALLSPSNFVLSPSLLPSPSTFLKDFPFLKPPLPSSPAFNAADAALPPSPKLSMEAARLYDSLCTPKPELQGNEFFGSKLEESVMMRSPALGFLSSTGSNLAGMEAAEGGDHHHHQQQQDPHSLQRSPLGFPNYSPGPLTRYLTDLPVLSPAGAYKWIENDPSPAPQSSRSHGLPPRPPSQYRSDA